MSSKLGAIHAKRELPSAELSLTLPILMIGLSQDENVVDISKCDFEFTKIDPKTEKSKTSLEIVTGKGNFKNRWRIVHGYLSGVPMPDINCNSPTGPMLDPDEEEVE